MQIPGRCERLVRFQQQQKKRESDREKKEKREHKNNASTEINRGISDPAS
jgi:hypothetical protein